MCTCNISKMMSLQVQFSKQLCHSRYSCNGLMHFSTLIHETKMPAIEEGAEVLICNHFGATYIYPISVASKLGVSYTTHDCLNATKYYNSRLLVSKQPHNATLRINEPQNEPFYETQNLHFDWRGHEHVDSNHTIIPSCLFILNI